MSVPGEHRLTYRYVGGPPMGEYVPNPATNWLSACIRGTKLEGMLVVTF